MKKIIKKIIFVTFILVTVSTSVIAQSRGNSLIENGISSFKKGQYSDSLGYFRDVVIDSNLKNMHADAYFWISKSYMALRELDNAEENLEFFLINFPKNKYYQEALYQKGRLMFLQHDYENCIQEFQNFLERFPKSVYSANAVFWTAESLYSLGRLEDAESLYTHIIKIYPSSYKVESSKYRLSMIEQKYREESLVELLKLTHEEYLKSLEEFQVREKTYENALDSYQKKLSIIDRGASDNSGGQTLSLEILDLQNSLRNKDNEIMALKRKISELEYRLTNAETRVSEAKKKITENKTPESKNDDELIIKSAPEKKYKNEDRLSPEDKIKLLEIKSRAQDVKEFYLEYLGSLGSE